MRILEQEVMMSDAEVVAYDVLVRKYFKILHAGFVETVINMSPPEGRFLDVGTGTGWISIGVAKNTFGIEVTGVDLSDAMLKVASRNAQTEGVHDKIKFTKGDAKRLPFDDGTYDAVFCHNMLHHIPEPDTLVTEMVRVMKKDGALIIRDLKRHSRFITELHVNLLGLTYNRLMKKEYRESILAALSEEEWRELFCRMQLERGRITTQFITHVSYERPSLRRRNDYINIPTPLPFSLFKSLYVSKP